MIKTEIIEKEKTLIMGNDQVEMERGKMLRTTKESKEVLHCG